MLPISLFSAIAIGGILIYTSHNANETEEKAALIDDIKKMNRDEKNIFAKSMAENMLLHFSEGELPEGVENDERYLELKKVLEEDSLLKIARDDIKPLLKDIVEEKPINKSAFELKLIPFKKALEKHPQYKNLSWTGDIILSALPE